MINITINIESLCLGGGESGPQVAPIDKVNAFLGALRGVVDTARAHLEDQIPDDGDGDDDGPEVDAEFTDPESDDEPAAETETTS